MARDFEDHCWKDIVDDEILEIYEPYRRDVKIGRGTHLLHLEVNRSALWRESIAFLHDAPTI